MKEEKPHACRALSISRKDSTARSKTSLSSFIHITFPQPKIRIKMDKLLAKTLRRRNPQKSNDDSNKKKRWMKTGNNFSRKVGSIVSNVFGMESSRRKDEIVKGETKTEAIFFPQSFNERNGKKVSSSNLSRVSNRKVLIGRGRRRTVRKKEIKDDEDEGENEEEERDGEEELCKKRILMGQKCRPLHQSGLLHYDENGVLLPEVDFLCKEW